MRQPDDVHLGRAWRVHELAADFDLLDVWRFPVQADADVPLEAFVSFLFSSEGGLAGGSGLTGFLFWVRRTIGNLLDWDGDEAARSIPGSSEHSVRDRLSAEDRSRDRGPIARGSSLSAGASFDFVYRFEDEALLEISNATVHALLHLGRVPQDSRPALKAAKPATSGQPAAADPESWAPELAVYVRPRGGAGRFYMVLIGPFRHAIVYPALMRGAAAGWPQWLRTWRPRLD